MDSRRQYNFAKFLCTASRYHRQRSNKFKAFRIVCKGGIYGKVKECIDIAVNGMDVFICKAGSESSREVLLNGFIAYRRAEWKGTRISLLLDA